MIKQDKIKSEVQENTGKSSSISMEQNLADQRKRFKFSHKPSRSDNLQNPRNFDDLQQNLTDFMKSAATGIILTLISSITYQISERRIKT